MILTKTEFSNEFKFNSLSSVSHLLKAGTIVANNDGLIDTNDKRNKAWIKRRRTELKKEKKEKLQQQKQQKPETQLNLEIDLLNSKLNEKRNRNKLLDLKIKKESGEVIETSVLNRVLIMIFDDFFKNLAEFPTSYASDIIDIVKAEENPKEKLIEFLTEHIISNIKNGLENTRKAAKKYYE